MALALAAAAILAVAAAGRAAAQVRDWPSEPVPKPLATRAVNVPPYEVRTLANGLRVVVVEHHEQPVVSLRLLVGAGTAEDPMPKLGVANMVASLLDQGTASRSARQIAVAVDSIGGNLSIGAGTDATLASFTMLRDSLDEGLDLLSDLVRAPAFAPGDLERQREHLRSALRASYQDPEYLATIVFRRLVYGAHPYGYPATGTPTSIERITRSDLVEYHERYFAPGNCMLAVAGDVPAGEAFEAVEKTFGGWAPRPVLEPIVIGPPAPTRRVVIVDVPDAAQTEVRVGQLGIRRDARDFMAVNLAVRILGGDGASRLQQMLIKRRGLAYGASADLSAYRTAGDIAATIGTRPELTGAALRVIIDEFFRLQREPVATRELDAANAFLAGRFPLSIETPDGIAARVLTSIFYGVPLAELGTFRDRVRATTPADIQRVARAHLRPDSPAIVLVGYAPVIADALQRVGLPSGEVVALADLDVTAADFRRPPGPAASVAPSVSTLTNFSREDWEQVRSVLDQAAAAAGGLDALRGVKTMRATATTVMQTPGGPMRATTRTFIEYPGRMRVDATLPAGEVVQAYVDGQAWLRDRNGIRDAPQPMRDQFSQGLRRDWIALLLAAADNRLMGRLLPDEKGLAGRPLRVVELWSAQLLPVRVAIDAGTHLIAWIRYETADPGGRVAIRESFDDYREVKGIKIPFTAVVRRDNAVMVERSITDLQINVAFPPAFFRKVQ